MYDPGCTVSLVSFGEDEDVCAMIPFSASPFLDANAYKTTPSGLRVRPGLAGPVILVLAASRCWKKVRAKAKAISVSSLLQGRQSYDPKEVLLITCSNLERHQRIPRPHRDGDN